MSYHETFWVVTGTAAPVIALAAIAALPDISYEEVIEPIANEKPEPSILALSLLASLAAAIRWGTILNLLLQAGLLAASLAALAYYRDLMPLWLAIIVAVGGVLLLAITTVARLRFRKLSQPILAISDLIISVKRLGDALSKQRGGDGQQNSVISSKEDAPEHMRNE